MEPQSRLLTLVFATCAAGWRAIKQQQGSHNPEKTGALIIGILRAPLGCGSGGRCNRNIRGQARSVQMDDITP